MYMDKYLHRSDNINGIFYSLKNDERIGWSLQNDIVWDGAKINEISKYIKKDTMAIDIGANIGTHSIPYSKLVGKNGIVCSYEPQSVIYNILNRNLQVNNVSNVRAFKCALGHTEMKVSMSNTVSDGKSKGKLLSYKSLDPINYGGIELGNHGENTEMRTLDSFNFDNVSFIKIDVEGCEKLVIYGGKETIRKNMPVILYEYKKQLTKDMIKVMKIPKSIVKFDIIDFCVNELGYQQPRKMLRDFLLLPPNIN
jgi:FkbM family methyltransferase